MFHNDYNINNLFKGFAPLMIGAACLLLPYGAQASGDDDNQSGGNRGKQWRFHGIKKDNNANASSITKIKESNIHDLRLKAIYNIENVPGPDGTARGENAVGGGIAVSRDGFIYVPTTDGRIHVLYADETEGVNPDGTKIPKVKEVLDLLSDEYTGGNLFDGDDVFMNRMQPSLSGKWIFAGNYDVFFAVGNPDLLGVPIPFDFTHKSQGAFLYQINRHTGELKRKIQVDDNPHSMILNSVMVHHGLIFVALSSEMSGNEGMFLFPYLPGGPDPFLAPEADGSFDTSKSGLLYRNAMVAIDKATGDIVWKTYIMPESPYRSPDEVFARDNLDVWNSGSSWGGGNYPIDKKRRQIYMGTGESLNAPQAAIDCEYNRLLAGGPLVDDGSCLNFDANGNPIGPVSEVSNVPADSAISSSSHALPTSVIALDYETGKIKWARRMHGFDVWNFACISELFQGFPVNVDPLCPSYIRPTSPFSFLNFTDKDMDVGEQPMLVKNVQMPDGGNRDLLIATNKKANMWALDPDNGDIIWGPVSFGEGSLFAGGILWGSATDRQRIYTKSTTSGLVRGDLLDPSKKVVPSSCPADAFQAGEGGPLPSDPLLGGIYAALDAATGELEWQRCLTGTLIDPSNGLPLLDENGMEQQVAGFNEGPLTVANGVVFVQGATTSYGFAGSTTMRAEVVALDAEDGTLLKRFPLNAPGEPSAYLTRYTRPTVIGDLLILGNGLAGAAPVDGALARRVVIYELQKYCDWDGHNYDVEYDPDDD